MEKIGVAAQQAKVANPGEKREADHSGPWWHYKMVWLVIGGPLVVVVAGVVTAVIAIRGADPVMSKAEMEASVQGQKQELTPAVQARNHAAAPN